MTTSSSKDIFDAAANNDTKTLEYFVETQKVGVTQTNDDEETPAHIAAKVGNLNMLKYLLHKNLGLAAAKDLKGNTVLDLAAENGTIAMVKYLLENVQVDILRSNNLRLGNTVLHIAAQAGQLSILKYLLEERKLDPNLRNHVGQPPAFLAATNKHIHIIKYLVEDRQANVTIIDNNESNILYMSVLHGDLTVPKYLLDERKIDLDVNWRDQMGETVLQQAARYNQLEFVKYLVEEKHVLLDQMDLHGRSALHEAATKGNVDIIKYLVERGADVEIKDLYNMTPLRVAIDEDVIEYLNGTRRARRSLSESLLGSSGIRTLGTDRILVGNPSRVAKTSSFELNGILLLAKICMRRAKNAGNPVSFFSSPREVIFQKIDPTALDVVRST